MERTGVPGHLWVLLLIPIALWLTPPVSGINAGLPCNITDVCVPNAACTDAICQCGDTHYNNNGTCDPRVPLNSPCTDTDQCEGVLQCDARGGSDMKCRVPLNSPCTDTDHCVGVLQCNARGGSDMKCRVPLNSPCTDTDHCVGALQCDARGGSDMKCRVLLNSPCTDTDHCVGALQCDARGGSDMKCRVPLNSPCTDTDHCVGDLQCDARGGSDMKCRIPAGSNEQCSDTTACVTDAVCDSLLCKIDLGKSCSGTSPDDHCKANTTCVQISVGSTAYQCRRIYGEQCTLSPECQTVLNEECVGTNPKRCLCKQDYFRLTTCRSKDILTTTPSRRGQAQEKSINVTWTWPASLSGASLEYKATRTDPSGTTVPSPWSADRHYNFMNLIQGTAYTISVTTKIQSNPGYGTGTVEYKGPDVNIYTKPAVPGNLTASEYPGPDVTLQFARSAGHVDRYDVTLEPGTHTGSATNPQDGGLPSVKFPGLTPGAFYDVTIVAVITGPNAKSEPSHGKFRVKANSSGEVDGLSVPNTGSRWVEASWQKPVRPNGNMTGYVVVALVTSPQQCASAIIVRCTDCNNSMTEQNATLTRLNCDTSSIQNTTSSELNSDTKFTGNLTGLRPDVNYTVRVYPYNEAGEGAVGHIINTTKQEAAEPLQDVRAVPGGVGQLIVTWIPGLRTGDTNYIVTWEEETSLNSDIFTLLNSTTITGYDNQRHQINGLLSYWNYRVSVQASAPLGASDNITVPVRTRSSEPGQVQGLQLAPDENDASKLVLTFNCPKEKERNGNISKFVYSSSTANSEFPNPRKPKGELPWESDCAFDQTLEVSAQTEYTINVYAVTVGNLNGSISTKSVNISATPPLLKETSEEPLLKEKEGSVSSMHTVELEVCPCVVNTDQGIITMAGISVCVPPENNKTQCDPVSEQRVQPLSDPQKLLTWKKFRAQGHVGIYRATPDDWHITQFSGSSSGRRRRSTTTDQFTSYTIGENTTCDGLDKSVYCNGPLPPGTDFRIFIWACTSKGCSQAGPLRVATQPDDPDPNIGAIVGGIFAAVAVIALVVVAVIMYRRYRPKDDDGHTTLTPTAPRVIRKPIKLKDFTAHLDRLHKDSNLLFQEEFEDVQENSPKQYSQEAATLDVNKVKNRYVNILPYDHTRVKLITDDDDDSSDFINANYIPGYTSPREYIATQGPMTGTIADFWRMMWEQKSSLVVMLSDLQEKGRPKVDMYWPGEMNSPVQYGDIVVELTSDSTLNKYTIRTFKLYVENNPDDSRRVTQYFIPGWEDYSANLSPDDVLDFIGSVRQAARSGQGQGPVCVHCSAGVGRTGTFIALDFLMQFVSEHSLDDEVDIYNLVLNMRHNRPYMVQSEKQYVFIHDTLKLIIDRKIKEMQAQDEHVYGNTEPVDNIYANQAFEPDENLYENTTSMSGKPTTSL